MGMFAGIDQQHQLDQCVIIDNTPDNHGLVIKITGTEVVFPIRKTGKGYIDNGDLKYFCKAGTENLGSFSTNHFHGIVPCAGIFPDRGFLNQVDIR
jgi:hypothetical protein